MAFYCDAIGFSEQARPAPYIVELAHEGAALVLCKAESPAAVGYPNRAGVAHVALAYVLAYADGDWNGAEREDGRALALQPSATEVHHALSRLLAARGRIPEAIAEAERAYALDPLSLVAHANA